MSESFLKTFLKRMVSFILVLLVLALVIFVLARGVSSAPAPIALEPSANQAQINAIRQSMGLDWLEIKLKSPNNRQEAAASNHQMTDRQII
ncbi:hypothetical protein [uncultured Cohaesibacter sp.]|uniref:hypothetical protein n=1 Tax=uncultured Cohaesibacter sp. TaxID=1002546 RepID=UPI002AA7067D|nr:hypothetical protein [uncultured Cohaesibacter sp.]